MFKKKINVVEKKVYVPTRDVMEAIKLEREIIAKHFCGFCNKNQPISSDDPQYHVVDYGEDPTSYGTTGKRMHKCNSWFIRQRTLNNDISV